MSLQVHRGSFSPLIVARGVGACDSAIGLASDRSAAATTYSTGSAGGGSAGGGGTGITATTTGAAACGNCRG